MCVRVPTPRGGIHYTRARLRSLSATSYAFSSKRIIILTRRKEPREKIPSVPIRIIPDFVCSCNPQNERTGRRQLGRPPKTNTIGILSRSRVKSGWKRNFSYCKRGVVQTFGETCILQPTALKRFWDYSFFPRVSFSVVHETHLPIKINRCQIKVRELDEPESCAVFS